jgi:diguanylate cyclase (GGDEF)-like protein/PAS domain S-box-containing protein
MAEVQILVVEDDSIVVMELRYRLQNLGYAVSGVASFGEEAIEKATEMRPDLVLMDIRLKGAMNGVRAAEEIRARFDIPVVYLTAYADEATLQRAKLTEPYGYIIKPFEERELHTTIEVALYKHEMERRLKRSERWLGTVLRSISDAVIATDREGLVTFMNPVAEALTGWRQEEALGKDLIEIFNIVNEQTRIPAENPATRALREGVIVGLADHTILIARDGKETPLDDSAAPIRDDKGNVAGVVLVFRDVTERKRAEESLQESEEKYKKLVENSAYGFFMMDLDGKYTYCNRVGEEIVGYSNKELHKMDFSDLIIEEDIQRARHDFEEVAAGYPNTGPRVYRIKTKTGKNKDIEVNTLAIWKKGQIVGFHGTAVDITERKRAEEEIRQRTAQLEALRQVGLELTAQLDLDALLQSLVSRAIELLMGTCGGLYLYRPEEDVLEWAMAVGPHLAPIGTVLHRGEGLSGKVWEIGEALIVDNYQTWEGRAAVYEDYPFRAVVGVPVRWGEEFLGVLNVLADLPRTFYPADAELLSLFATQAAIAIRNARLYEESRRRALEQETVSRIAYALNTPDVRDAFPVLVKGLQDLTGCDMVNLVVMDEAGEQFIMSVLGSPVPTLGVGDVIPLSATAAAEDVEAGRPHLTADLSTETHFPFEQALHQAGLRSQVTLPLLVGGEVFGALNLGGSDPGLFREDQLPVLRQIADAVALTLENSLLFRLEREQRELAESLEEAAAVVSSTLDPDQVLDRILEQVSRVVPNDATNIMLIEGDQAHVVRWRGYERFGAEEIVSAVVFRIAEVSGFQQMLERGEPIVIPDTATDPGWVRVPATEWLRSYAAAPIIVRGEVIGFLNVDSATPGFFAQAHAEALRVFADHAAAAIENARLFGEEKRRSAQLALISEVGDKAVSILDSDKLMQEVTRYIQEKFNYYNVALLLLDEERREVVMRAVAGGFEHIAPGEYRQSLDEGIVGFVTRTGNSWLANDISKDPHYVKGFLGEVLTKSELCVPIKLGDKVIGALDVQSIRLNDFDQADVAAMEAVADQIAIAIQNAKLYGEANRRAEEMVALHKIGLVTTSTLDLDEVLRLIHEQVSQLMKPDTFYIALYDEQKKEMNVEIYVEKGQDLGKFSRKLEEGGLTSWIIQSNQPLLIRNTAKESFPTEPLVVGEFAPELSYLGVPLLAKGKVIGVISVQSFQPYVFDEGDQRFLSAIANQATIAIENARLFEETRWRSEELAALNAISQDITSSLDLDETLQRIVDSTRRLTGARRSRILLINPQVHQVFKDMISGYPPEEKGNYDYEQFEQGISGWVVREKRAALVPDVLADERSVGRSRAASVRRGTKSVMVAPLMVRGEVIGTLAAVNLRDDAIFTKEDMALVEQLAAQAAIAIENAQLYEETQRQSERLAQTLTLSEMLHGGLELEQVLEQIAQGAVRLGFRRAVINVCQPEQDWVRVRAIAGLEGSEREELMGVTYRWSDLQTLMQERFQVSRSYLIRQGEVDWDTDLQGIVITTNGEDRGPGYWRPEDMLLVPLWGTHGQPVGLLLMDEPVDGLLPDLNTIQTLEAFANQAAIAIENARLFEETERLKAFNENVVQGVAEAILIEDAQGILTFANPAVEELLGYTREELIGLHWSALTPEDEVEKVSQETAKRPQGIVSRYETVLLDKKGQHIPVIVSARPLFEENEFAGVLSAFTDITELKQAEEALRDEKTLMDALMDNIPDSIYFKDRQCRLIRINRKMMQDLNLDEMSQAIGKTDVELFGEEFGRKTLADDEHIMATGEPVIGLIESRQLEDGQVNWTLSTKVPLPDASGQIMGLVGVTREINELKRAEEELRASEEKFRQFFENEPEYCYMISPDGAILDVNSAALKALGYRKEELVGKPLQTIYAPESLPKMEQLFAKWKKAGHLRNEEIVIITKKGDRRTVLHSAGVVKDRDGKTLHSVSVQRDITQRKRVEREIEERRLYLEGVLGAAPDAIVTADARHRIVEWNPGAERLFGYSREEAIGQNLDHLVTNPDVFEEAIGFTQVVKSGREVSPVETVRYRKDGSPVDVIVAASPILVGDELVGVVAVYTDITQHKRMEEALRASLLVDELTGLYNRRGFLTLGQQQLKTAHRAKSKMSLLFADFDDLKRINDTLGHHEGDQALIDIADVLKEIFRESDIIARIGGDEFVVLVIETDGVSAEILTTRLQENLEARNARGDRRYKLSLSVGTARYDPESPCSIDELLAQADRLMYEQKQDDQMR